MIQFNQRMKQVTDKSGPNLFIEVLEAEIRSVINEDNTDFIRQYCSLIPDVLKRGQHRLRNLTPNQIMRLYGELAFELALCEEKHGSYLDQDIATICVGLRLQRKLDRMFDQPKRNGLAMPMAPAQAKFCRKPKAPSACARAVA